MKGAFKKSGDDNRHGAVNWTHIDNSQITYDNSHSPFSKKGYVNAEKAGEWKKFSSFEVQDHKFRMRDQMKKEGERINAGLIAARDNNLKTQYDTRPSNWIAPEIEVASRSFAEGARYFPPFDKFRAHGLKNVPVPAGNVA